MIVGRKLFLTDQNHFEYGRVQGHPEVYFSKVTLPEKNPGSAYEEATQAARLIYENAKANGVGAPLTLCLSGGIDSEVMALSFLAAGVPFRAVTLRFRNGLNDFDIENVTAFCDRHRIERSFIDLDVIDFLESGRHLEFGRRYQCQSPQLAVHLWMLDQVAGYPVLSGNFIYPEFTDAGVFYLGLPGELHAAYFRYFEVNGRAGVPWFLIYTPKLVRAFLDTPVVRAQYLAPPPERRHFTYEIKCAAYQQGGFDVKPRADKFTGFEKIRQLYDEKFGTNHGTKFDDLFRRPLVEMNPLPQEFLQIIDGSVESPVHAV